MIDEFKFKNESKGKVNTPAAEHSFKMNKKYNKLNKEKSEIFHIFVAKGLFLSKRACPNIQLAIVIPKSIIDVVILPKIGIQFNVMFAVVDIICVIIEYPIKHINQPAKRRIHVNTVLLVCALDIILSALIEPTLTIPIS